MQGMHSLRSARCTSQHNAVCGGAQTYSGFQPRLLPRAAVIEGQAENNAHPFLKVFIDIEPNLCSRYSRFHQVQPVPAR